MCTPLYINILFLYFSIIGWDSFTNGQEDLIIGQDNFTNGQETL